MTTTPSAPQKPAEDYEGATEEQWQQWRDDYNEWELRYKWLPQVLSGQELAEAQAMEWELLVDKYFAVLDGGPLGGVWYNQLVAMRELLRRNRFKPWIQRRFLDDYIQTHNLDNYPKWPEGQEPTLYQRASEEGLIGAYWPDVDSYYEDTTIGEFFYYRPVWKHFKRLHKHNSRLDTHFIGEVHSWTTSLANVLAEFPHYVSLLKAHDEFVARWNLPTENVPSAGYRKRDR